MEPRPPSIAVIMNPEFAAHDPEQTSEPALPAPKPGTQGRRTTARATHHAPRPTANLTVVVEDVDAGAPADMIIQLQDTADGVHPDEGHTDATGRYLRVWEHDTPWYTIAFTFFPFTALVCAPFMIVGITLTRFDGAPWSESTVGLDVQTALEIVLFILFPVLSLISVGAQHLYPLSKGRLLDPMSHLQPLPLLIRPIALLTVMYEVLAMSSDINAGHRAAAAEKASLIAFQLVELCFMLLLLAAQFSPEKRDPNKNSKNRALTCVLMYMCIVNVVLWYRCLVAAVVDEQNVAAEDLFGGSTWRLIQAVLLPFQVAFHMVAILCCFEYGHRVMLWRVRIVLDIVTFGCTQRSHEPMDLFRPGKPRPPPSPKEGPARSKSPRRTGSLDELDLNSEASVRSTSSSSKMPANARARTGTHSHAQKRVRRHSFHLPDQRESFVRIVAETLGYVVVGVMPYVAAIKLVDNSSDDHLSVSADAAELVVAAFAVLLSALMLFLLVYLPHRKHEIMYGSFSALKFGFASIAIIFQITRLSLAAHDQSPWNAARCAGFLVLIIVLAFVETVISNKENWAWPQSALMPFLAACVLAALLVEIVSEAWDRQLQLDPDTHASKAVKGAERFAAMLGPLNIDFLLHSVATFVMWAKGSPLQQPAGRAMNARTSKLFS